MKKGKVKFYQLNINDEGIKKNRVSVFEEDDDIQNDGLPKEIDEILHTNPFLYKETDKTKKYVLSIEDFYITCKNVNLPLGSFVRNSKISKFKRRKIVKKQFKIWSKDAKNKYKSVFKYSGESIKLASQYNILTISIFNKLLLLVGFIIPILVLLKIIPTISLSVELMQTLAIITSGVSLIGIIFSIYYTAKVRSHKNFIKTQKTLQNKYLKSLEVNFKKFTKKNKKYYVKNIKKNGFKKAPLPIKKSMIGGDKIDYMEKVNDDINKKTIEILKTNNRFNFTYFMSILLSYLTSIVSIGYVVYIVIYKIIKIIFAKGE